MLPYSQKEELEIKSHVWVFLFLKIIVLTTFSLLIFRLWFLQIHEGKKLKDFSNINRFKKQVVSAPRGLIKDREGKILVKNATTAQLKIDLNYVQDLEVTLTKIAPILSWSKDKIKERIERNKKKYGIFHPILIKNHLSLEEIYKLKWLKWDHLEILVEEGGTRIYTLEKNGAQVLGFIGQASPKDLKELKNIKQGEIIGKSGVEKIYNSHLKGTSGISFLEVDAHNRIFAKSLHQATSLNQKATQGKNIFLTIDSDIQKAAWKAFQRQDSIGARKGAVIVMKTNGEILAWASSPSFNANVFSFEMSETFWNQFTQNSTKSFLNKGLQEHYPPGSTFKPFVALAALEEGLIDENTLIESGIRFRVGNKVFHDHSKTAHGKINLETALEKSANTFFYRLAFDLKIDKILKYTSLFSFGKLTQIDLEGEIKGNLPSPEWKKKTIGQPWQRGETIGLAIGQSYLLTTLLQLTIAYNTIATEGLVVKPFLLHKVEGESLKQAQILDTLTDRINRKSFKIIKRGLDKVVQGKKGTARWWNLKNFPYSGKTGTAQVVGLSPTELFKSCKKLPLEKRHHGLFVGYAPSDSPEIVISVLTENSCFGSSGSVPIARDIFKAYMKKYKGNPS